MKNQIIFNITDHLLVDYNLMCSLNIVHHAYHVFNILKNAIWWKIQKGGLWTDATNFAVSQKTEVRICFCNKYKSNKLNNMYLIFYNKLIKIYNKNIIEHAYLLSHLIYLFTAKWRPRVKKTCAPKKDNLNSFLNFQMS